MSEDNKDYFYAILLKDDDSNIFFLEGLPTLDFAQMRLFQVYQRASLCNNQIVEDYDPDESILIIEYPNIYKEYFIRRYEL